jgi:hypothetical protein
MAKVRNRAPTTLASCLVPSCVTRGTQPRRREEDTVFEPNDACRVQSVVADGPRQDVRRGLVAARRPTLILILGLGAGLVLGACAIPFGSDTDQTSQSPKETRRERNRLYLEEQERTERTRLFERVGPSDR